MENEAAGLDKNFVIYDTDDQVALIKRIMKEQKITDKSLKPKSIQSIISSCKNRGETPGDYARDAFYPNQKATAKIFQYYEKEKEKASALDFDDLLLRTLKLFQENLEVREKWKNRFKHILIDEYQDTNDIQEAFINLIANNNVFQVGDIKQSIYGFRGANCQLFAIKYRRYQAHSGGKLITLSENFRTRKTLIDEVNNIFSLTMTGLYGGCNYKGQHELGHGQASYDESENAENYSIETYIYLEIY